MIRIYIIFSREQFGHRLFYVNFVVVFFNFFFNSCEYLKKDDYRTKFTSLLKVVVTIFMNIQFQNDLFYLQNVKDI
jgi:hypothetical protein